MCADVCDDSKAFVLAPGVTKIKAPKTALRDPRCACDASSYTLWAMSFQLPPGTTCAGVYSFAGAPFNVTAPGDPLPTSCDLPNGGCTTITDASHIIAEQQAPGFGGVFTIVVSNAATCALAPCDTFGCNGTGGVQQ
jgi:hypothetical protein